MKLSAPSSNILLSKDVSPGTNPLSANSDSDGTNDTFEDFDHDGYCSLEEYRHHTLPLFFDSDSALLPDGYDPFPLFADG